VRRLEEMRSQRAQRPSKHGSMKLNIDSGERSGMLVCELSGTAFGYEGKSIVPPLDLTIMRGDKIGILGRNGVGKSTLLRGLLGQLAPIQGTVRLGTKLDVAYFDQTREVLDPEQTAEENVGVGRTSVMVGGRNKHVIGYLQDFLFTPEQARSKIQFLSGGQRNRLLLAKLFAQSANLLVMDEPTNDLDAESLELLEERLVEYEGTLLVVSHDRAFLNNVVTSLIVFEEDGIKEYVGGYDDWLRQRASSMRNPNARPKASTSQKSESTSGPSIATPTKSVKKLSYKEKLELEELPGKIEQMEQEQSQLHAAMNAPDYFKQPSARLTEDQQKLEKLDGRLSEAYQRWESLSERAEG
jgi:ATP-binding cassette subfamily F protein uup